MRKRAAVTTRGRRSRQLNGAGVLQYKIPAEQRVSAQRLEEPGVTAESAKRICASNFWKNNTRRNTERKKRNHNKQAVYDGAVDLTFEQDLMHLIKKKNIFYIFDVAAGSEKKFCFYT